jgi:hypothetical protein
MTVVPFEQRFDLGGIASLDGFPTPHGFPTPPDGGREAS